MAKTSSLRPSAWAAALAAAVVVFVPLAFTPGAHVVSAPTFLAKLLGPTDTSAPLVRRPNSQVRVVIRDSGFAVAEGNTNSAVALAFTEADGAEWRRFANGVDRPTPFGRETIVVGPDKAEEFLTVTKRQGGKAWRWRLDAGGLTPRLGSDGAVAFLHGNRLTDTFIAPVAIYDADGKDVTPGGLRWSLEGARSSWWLKLRLNDSKLPLPYVIDPAVVFRSASSGVNTLGLTMTLPAPAGVADRDVLVAQITGRYTAGPGTPAGWQLVRTNNMGSGAQAITQSVFVRVAGASEPATYTWTWPTNVRGSGGIGAYAGVDTTAAVNVSSGAGGTGALVTAPSVTTTADNAMLVGFFGMNFPGGTTFLPPAGMTERWDIAGEGVSSESADAAQLTAGASGAKTATAVGTEEWVAQLVALRVDATGPTFPALSLAENPADPDQHVSGTTLFYRPGGGGSFTITASPSETQSVVRDVAFPAIATVGGGGIADAAPPYDQTYTWGALTSASGAQNVTAANTAGATSTQIFSLAPDSSPPSGGSISYPDGLDADGVVAIATADGSDAGAGVNAASAVLERQTAALSGGTCGTFGAWSAVTSPDTVPSGNCAKYRYRVSDNVGNEAVYTSPSVVQVAGGDATPPTAPALVLSEAEPDEHVVGTTVYYNPSGTNAGSFTVEAASSDAESGITRVDFPAVFGLDSSSDATGPYQATYSWTAPSAATGPMDVTAVNGAGLTASSSFTVTPDTAAPSVSISAPITGAAVKNGVTVDASAADALAGVAQVEFGYCGGLSCTWLLATPIGTDATAPYSVAWDAHPADGTYTLLARASDQVGNTAESAVTVIADNTPPTSALSLVEGARADLQRFDAGASTLYYNPAAAGDFRLVETASDALAGVQKVDFPAVTETGFSGPASSDLLAPYESSLYSFGPTNAVAPGPAAVVVSDLAGNSRADTISFVRDTLPPSGGSVSYVNGYDTSGSVIVTTANGSDAGAGVNAATALLERDGAPLANASCAGFADAWTAVSSPDTTVASGNCYRYRYVVADHVGNSATYTSTNVVKVDTSTPTEPALSLAEAPASPSQHVDGTTLYYNPQGANSGSFTVAAATSDPDSAVSQVSFPGVFGADAAADTLAPYTHSYSWTATAATTGAQLVTTTNGAGLTASASFTVTPDTAGPSISFSSPAVGAAIRNGAAVSAAALDALAGTADVEFRYCPGSACAWSLGTPLGADSTAPYSVAWSMQPPDGTYTLVARGTDNVGNAVESIAITVTVDNTAPIATQSDPGSPLAGTVTLTATASDGLAGIDSVTFEASPAGQELWSTIASDSLSPYSGSWDTLTVADGRYDLRVIASDRAGNRSVSTAVLNRQVANHPPIVTLTAPEGPYVNEADPDPFTLTATSPETDLGGVEFFRCTDASVNCETGTWVSLGIDTAAPYASPTPWTVDVDGPRALKAVATNLAGSEGVDVNTVLIDRTPPSGGSISYPDGYDADGSLVLTASPGTDAGSGIDLSSGVTERQTAPLADGACGAFGAWTGAPLNPDALADGSCSRYRYHILDEAGNEAVYGSASVVKVDLTAPSAPSLSLSESEPDEHAAGTTLYYNPSGTNAGSFTVRAAASDAQSGIASVDFPSIFGADAGSDSVVPHEATYSWTAAATASGAKTVMARNSAGLATGSDFTVTPDTAAPSGGSISYPDGPDTDGSITITAADGTDPLSGLDTASTVIERRTAPLAGASCGPFAESWTPVANPDALPSGNCAQYRYRISDNVGNEVVYVSANVVKVDVVAPETTIDSSPPNPSRSTDAAFLFTSSELDSAFECALDDALFAPCSSPQAYTGLADQAAHTFRVRASDAFGNVDSTPATYTWTVETVDVTPPTITLTGKPADPSNDAAPSFAFTASEPVLLFECQLDGGGYLPCVSPKSHTGLADGSHTFDVRATDFAGNVGVSSHTWILDVTPPVATQNDPGSLLEGLVALSATASDPVSGVDTVIFEYSPGGQDQWTAIAADSLGPYAATWDTLAVPDGRYDLRVLARDRAGNEAASAVVSGRQVANHPPIVSISAPDGSFVNGAEADPFVVTASSPETDLRDVEFFRCTDASTSCATGTWVSLGVDTSAPYAAAWAIDADGGRALKVVATNLVGSQGTDISNVLIDRTPPNGGSISYADGYDADGQVTVTAEPGSDSGSGLDTSSGVTERQTAALADGACSGFGAWTGAPLNPDTVPDGRCARYRYHIFDEAGNEAVYTSASVVRVDLSAPPAPALTLSEADAGAHAVGTILYYNPSTAGSFNVAAAAVDTQSEIARVDFPAVFGADGASDAVAPYEQRYSWASGATAAGAQVVNAENGAGLRAGADFTLISDAEPPSASLSLPPDGARIRNGASLAAAAADNLAGVAEVEFRYCAGPPCDWALATPIGSDAGAPYALAWNAQPADGPYTILARARDNVGHTSVAAAVSVVVDNAAPAVTLTEPGPYVNAAAPEPFAVTAATPDADVELELFRCTDASLGCATGDWVLLGSAPAASFSVQIASEPDGGRAFRAVASDGAGNTGEHVVDVVIDRTTPVGNQLVSSHTPGSLSADNTIEVALAALVDAVSGVDGFSVWWDTTPDSAPDLTKDLEETAATLTSPPLPDGAWYVHVRVLDNAGNWSDPAHMGPFVIDTTAPEAVFVGGAGLSSPVRLGRSIGVAWSAAADASAYDVRYRAAPLSGSFGEHVLWHAATTSTSGSFTGAPGTTYCFSARAYDALGNVTPWISDQCTALPLNNTKLAHRGTWAKKRSTGSYLGTHSATSTKGAKLIRTGVGAKRLALVATKCRGCGTVAVYWNGAFLKKISLARRTTARKQVIPVATFTSLRKGTVKVVVLSSGKPVLIEGLGASPL